MKFLPAILLLAPCFLCAEVPGTWKLEKGGRIYAVRGAIVAGTEVSGVASLDGRHALLVSNETRAAQCIEIDVTTGNIHPGVSLSLSAKSGEEMDLEAVAADLQKKQYFIAGSHAVSKKKGEARPDQCWLFQVPDPSANTDAGEKIKSVSLTESLRRLPLVAPHVGQPLQKNGLNIEGLACNNGRIFFGLRAPVVDGKCLILETDAAAVFADPMTCTWTVHQVALRPGSGIRDLAIAKDGFLILGGNSGSEPTGRDDKSENYDGDRTFSLHFWKPGEPGVVEEVGLLGDVPGRAEGLIILEENEHEISVLVFFDGASNGRPAAFRLIKPAPPKD